MTIASQNVRGRCISFKIARPDSSQNFMDTVKTICWTCLCIQLNNTVVFSKHTYIKFIKSPKQKKSQQLTESTE